MTFAWGQHLLCCATGPQGLGVLVAVRPELLPIEDGTGKPTGREVIVWFDADHQRSFELKSVECDEPDRFAFTDVRARRFELRPMTLDRYNRVVKTQLTDARDFEDEAGLWRFFLQGWGGFARTTPTTAREHEYPTLSG